MFKNIDQQLNATGSAVKDDISSGAENASDSENFSGEQSIKTNSIPGSAALSETAAEVRQDEFFSETASDLANCSEELSGISEYLNKRQGI